MKEMKKSALVFLFLFLFACDSYSQSGWFVTYQGNTTDIEALSFPNENTGYICSDSIKKTTDGGISWYVISNLSKDFTDAQFFNVNTGVFSEWFGGRIYKTTDGGNTIQLLGNVNYGIFSISFPSIDTGYILTKYHGIWKTTNGGVSCFESTGYYTMQGRVFFVNNQTGYATGHIGTVIKTTNGGAYWDSLRVGDIFQNSGVYFLTAETGYITGTKDSSLGRIGKVCKTTNGGSSWSLTNLDSSGNYQTHIYFINQNTGFIFGVNQTMFKTTNGGNSWIKFNDFYFSGLYRMQFVNELTGYASSYGGWVIKTTNGGTPIGIQPISNEFPNHFSLSQNYPNPFNPTTKIRFSITSPRPDGHPSPERRGDGSEVKLSVYDVLGKEVATLVNESATGGLKPGTYEVDWDGTNYSSGIYYYKLVVNTPRPDKSGHPSQEGTFAETKKMVLLK